MSGLSERLEARAECFSDPRYSAGIQLNRAGADQHAALLREAASLLDQYEKALEAGDELAARLLAEYEREDGPVPVDWESMLVPARAYRSLRTPTTEEGE